jgi:hypothetical protein
MILRIFSMKITLSEYDISQMPAELREELMQFIFKKGHNSNNFYDIPAEGLDMEYVDLASLFNDDFFPKEELTDTFKKSKKAKKVIGISEGQAKKLISNLSNKSIGTLEKFTTGDPVSIDNLVGEGKPYKDFVDLKRSFVGPVNRRLRTVTGDRTSVLFLKVQEDNGSRYITVKNITAAALESVL